jgi:lactate racemase
MIVQLKYGHASLELKLPVSIPVELIGTGRALPAGDEISVVESALANPIASRPLTEIVQPGQKVVLVTSDITRPCPSDRLLPHLLDELIRGGVNEADIGVVFALGTHRPQSQAEQKFLVGETVYRRVPCVDSNPADCVRLGETRRGTPVWVFRPVLEADVRVCVGNIEYHYFAGYSGGVKAIIPGVANAETIRKNHRWMTEPGAATGQLDHNPCGRTLKKPARWWGYISF